MTHFVKNGDTISVISESAVDIGDKLPVGTYLVKFDPLRGFWLEIMDDFVPLKKYYGNTVKYADRILNTFKVRNKTTGALLVGEKGSGKTLLAKLISIMGKELGYPTIIVNSPFINQKEVPGQKTTGDDFVKFLQTINQPCIIMFDEFEKIYNTDEQQSILTMLDGVFSSNKLFVLTSNDAHRIDRHLKNRPGRLHYMINFGGLEIEFIKEYCEDNLKYPERLQEVVEISSVFGSLNFDMLQALVEEINLYNESPKEVIKLLNTKPENEHEKYSSGKVMRVIYQGKEIPSRAIETTSIYDFYEASRYYIEIDGAEIGVPGSLTFNPEDVKAIDNQTRTYTFETDGNILVVKGPSPKIPWDYSKLM